MKRISVLSILFWVTACLAWSPPPDRLPTIQDAEAMPAHLMVVAAKNGGGGEEPPAEGITIIGTLTGVTTLGSSYDSIDLTSLSLQENDIVFCVTVGDAMDATNGIDYESATYTIAGNITGSPDWYYGYKRMGSTPDSSVRLGQHSATYLPYIIQAFRGVDTSNILDVASPTPSQNAFAIQTSFPSITPTTTGALILIVAGLDDKDLTVDTWPSGYTDTSEQNSGQAGVNGSSVAIASKLWSSGQESPGQLSWAEGEENTGITIAFRPAT